MTDTDFAAPFARLGEELDVAFRKAEHAEEAFADLAVEHLERARLHESFSLRELARWALTSPALPEQADPRGEFGDPPVTIWRGRRFFISALVWRSSTTSIHQHAFTGAFQVLHGSSIHARYAATPRLQISEDLALVDLSCTGIELLKKGCVRRIGASTRGIHSLFHLEHPSVSLVVRTETDHRHAIQYRYQAPGIAIHELRQESRQQIMRKIASMLASTDRPAGFEVLGEALATATSYDAFQLITSALRVTDLPYVERLLDTVRAGMDAETAVAFQGAFSEIDRQRSILSKRDAVREPRLRFLMAILLNAPSRASAVELAHAYEPAAGGVDSIVAWLSELSRATIKLQAAGVPWEPNVFGLPDCDAPSLAALRATLEGATASPSDDLPFYRAVREHPSFAVLFRD